MNEATHFDGQPVLRRLPAAAWRALPTLASTGVASVGLWWLIAGALGPASPAFVPAALVIATPGAALAIDAVQREVFDDGSGHRRRWRPVWLASLCAAATGAFAAWSTIAGAVAVAAESALFQVTAVTAAIAAAVVTIIAAVAIPVATARKDASARAVLIAATIAGVRRPFPPIAAVAASAAIGWLGLTWFAGLLVFVVPVFAVVAVAAAWSSAPPIGVALPPLSPLVRRTVASTSGAV